MQFLKCIVMHLESYYLHFSTFHLNTLQLLSYNNVTEYQRTKNFK